MKKTASAVVSRRRREYGRDFAKNHLANFDRTIRKSAVPRGKRVIAKGTPTAPAFQKKGPTHYQVEPVVPDRR